MPTVHRSTFVLNFFFCQMAVSRREIVRYRKHPVRSVPSFPGSSHRQPSFVDDTTTTPKTKKKKKSPQQLHRIDLISVQRVEQFQQARQVGLKFERKLSNNSLPPRYSTLRPLQLRCQSADRTTLYSGFNEGAMSRIESNVTWIVVVTD